MRRLDMEIEEYKLTDIFLTETAVFFLNQEPGLDVDVTLRRSWRLLATMDSSAPLRAFAIDMCVVPMSDFILEPFLVELISLYSRVSVPQER